MVNVICNFQNSRIVVTFKIAVDISHLRLSFGFGAYSYCVRSRPTICSTNYAQYSWFVVRWAVSVLFFYLIQSLPDIFKIALVLDSIRSICFSHNRTWWNKTGAYLMVYIVYNHSLTHELPLNSFAPRKCDSKFTSVIFDYLLRMMVMCLSCEIVLRWMPQ